MDWEMFIGIFALGFFISDMLAAGVLFDNGLKRAFIAGTAGNLVSLSVAIVTGLFFGGTIVV